jgi:hypothetical protein
MNAARSAERLKSMLSGTDGLHKVAEELECGFGRKLKTGLNPGSRARQAALA